MRNGTRPMDLAIIGCGAVTAGLYRGALKKLESRGIARVVALVDPSTERSGALGRDFRAARAFTTTDQAFAQTRPELTIVASPAGRHAEHAAAAFAAGSHVLCEKPMTVAASDGERMLAASRDAGRVLAVGMVRRMFPCLAEARAVLASGVLGDQLRFVYREGLVYSWPVSTDAAFRRSTAGGGVLTDFGSHVLDFLAALFGAPTVTACADDALEGGVETNCRIDLAFPAASGSAQLSWSQPLKTELRVAGSAGELALDPGRIDSVRWRAHGGAWKTRVSDATWPMDLRPDGGRRTPRTYHECIYHQVVQVMRAVRYGEPVPASGEEGLTAVRAIEACYRQATALRLPWLGAHESAEAEARHWNGERWAAA